MAYNANYENVYAPASSTYYYIIEVAVREESYSIETNKSRLYLEADITGNGIGFDGSDDQYLEVYWYDTKNGEILGATTTYKKCVRDQLYQITGYIDVLHNDDGTLSGKAYTIWGKNGNNSYVPPSTTVEAPLTLTTIPRKSTATISGTPNIGSQITINTNRKANTFTHTLTYTFGSLSGTIGTNVGASINWTIPTSFYAQIPNATSGTMVITTQTYSGTTLVGTTTTNVTVYVTNSNPTFDVAYQDTNSTTTGITGNNQHIIQKKSTLQFNITNASAKNSATLSNVKVTINGATQTQSISSATKDFNYGTINVANNISATVVLTDSRGLTTTKIVALTILSWSSPTAIITLQRQSNYYTTTDIKVDANYSSLNSQNTISIKYRIKKKSESNWGSYVNLSDNVTATFNADNLYEWDVQVVVQDRLATTTYNLTLGIGTPILFIDRIKRQVGINCFPTATNAFAVEGDTVVSSIRTKNMFGDYPIINGWIDNGIVYVDLNSDERVAFISCKPNTTYTISRSVITSRFRVSSYNSIPIMTTSPQYININEIIKNESGTVITYTTPSTATYLLIEYAHVYNDSASLISQCLSSIQVEEGSTATTYSSYQNLNGYDSYSFQEQRIGTWVDGKPIYRKVVEYLGTKSNFMQIPHKIGNFNEIIKATGKVGVRLIPTAYGGSGSLDTTNYFCFIYLVNATNIEVSLSNYVKDLNDTMYFILEYTKTTD